jgi:hypothetical protein
MVPLAALPLGAGTLSPRYRRSAWKGVAEDREMTVVALGAEGFRQVMPKAALAEIIRFRFRALRFANHGGWGPYVAGGGDSGIHLEGSPCAGGKTRITLTKS